MNDTTTRKGRGKSAASLELIAASKRILQEIQPATVRAVCYRLFTEKLTQDMGKASTGRVGEQLVYAREHGIIPWEWIVDETRRPETIAAWDSPEQIIASAVRQYRKDYWATQPHRIEVWSEKGTVRGTVAQVLDQYGVTFRVMHGYGSATSIYGAAQDSVASDKPLTVFYIGDHDPSGRHMSDVDLPARLARYGGSLQIIRLALDSSDVAPDSKLPWFPASDKAKDKRYTWFTKNFGHRCFELDALPPPELRARLETAIVDSLDAGAWNHAVQVEKAETDSMRGIMGYFKESISSLGGKYSANGGAAV